MGIRDLLGVGILLAPGILLGDCVPGPGLGLAWTGPGAGRGGGEGGPAGLEKLGLRCTGLTIRAPLAGELNTNYICATRDVLEQFTWAGWRPCGESLVC